MFECQHWHDNECLLNMQGEFTRVGYRITSDVAILHASIVHQIYYLSSYFVFFFVVDGSFRHTHHNNDWLTTSYRCKNFVKLRALTRTAVV